MHSVTRKYNFVQQIGKGSFSQIYLVEDAKKGKPYALKHIPKKSYNTCQECQILQQIQKHPHRNLIGLKEILEDEKDILIIIDYVESGSLLNFMNNYNGLLPERKIRKLFSGLLDGVQHLHDKIGVVHRDIKLENILITDHEEPKIIDFNLSFFWNPEELQTKYCGTVVYCAPEIISGIPYYGPAQDIWSLGVVLYYLIFNCFPFSSDQKDKKEKRKSIMKHISACEYKFPSNRRVSPELLELLSSIFQLDPLQRPSLNEIKKHPWFRANLKDTQVAERSEEDIFAIVNNWNPDNSNSQGSNHTEEKKEQNTSKRKGSLKRLVERFGFLRHRTN